MKKILSLLLCAGILAGCNAPADVASYNLSKEADQFHVNRRIIFVNTWTDKELLRIEGLCSLGNQDKSDEVSVTCQVGPSEYKKHFLGLNGNVTYFVEQIEPNSASPYHYEVLFRPETLVPSIRMN